MYLQDKPLLMIKFLVKRLLLTVPEEKKKLEKNI